MSVNLVRQPRRPKLTFGFGLLGVVRQVRKPVADDLLEVLLSCPVKGFMPRVRRRKERMRKVRL